MDNSENNPVQEELIKAKILNRIIAKVIDFIIIGALFEIIPKVGFFAGLSYLLIGDGLFDGRSLGKRLIGLKVIYHQTGGMCSFRESIIRNFTFAAGYILLIKISIGFVFALLILIFESLIMIGNDRGMRFSDELAKTQVIEEK